MLPTAEPVPGSEVQSIQLVVPRQGWALTNERLAWTDDGGESWTDITPPGAQVSQIKTAFFLDTQRGWVLMVQPGAGEGETASSITVYRTSDGGATWRPASFAGPPVMDPGPPILFGTLQFTDGQHGWFAGAYQTGLQGSPHMYRTSDGGATWSEVALPDIGFIYTLGFRNGQDGWLAGNMGGGQPLYVTHDGGASWQTQAVPPDSLGALPTPPACEAIGTEYSSPKFPDAEHGVLLARWECGDSDTTLFYVTDNGGATWRETAVRSHVYPGLVAIVTRTTWIDPSGGQLAVTKDGGQHWEAIAVDWPAIVTGSSDPAQAGASPISLGFVSASAGWALLSREGTVTSDQRLIATSDGGHTWKLLQP